MFKKRKSIAPISRILFWHYCQCLPFIYSAIHTAALAFYPPSRAEAPQTDRLRSMVYMNLQPPVDTARLSPACWWSLTPPSHPYPFKRGGRSLLPSPTVANSFHFQKWGVLCCPDFPLASPFRNASGRPGQCFPAAKVTLFSDSTLVSPLFFL